MSNFKSMQKSINILSIHFDTHDSNASFFKNGEIIFSSAEERFSRKKNDNSAPIKTLKYCLDKYHIDPKQINKLIFTGLPFPKNLLRYAANRFLMAYFSYGMKFWRYNCNPFYYTGLNRLFSWLFKKREIMKLLDGFKGEISFVDHELCHVSSAMFTSGFDLEKTLGVVIEGSGWDKSSSGYVWENNKLKMVSQTAVLDSVGYFYDMVTELLGFKSNQDAGKVMSLAAYGNPSVAYDIVKKYISFDEKAVAFRASSEIYRYPREFKNKGIFPEELEGFSREDLAAAFQLRLENVVIDYIKALKEKYKKEFLVLAGGVFANVKLNQNILEKLKFKDIYIHPAMGDLGCSLGAALYTYNKDNFYNQRLRNVFLGEENNEEEIKLYLEKNNYEFIVGDNLAKDIAERLVSGKSVACFNGRAEYGPRALGNRSILCGANDINTQKWLNKKLGRPDFMPFAPIVLEDDFRNLFLVPEEKSIYTEEFMNITYYCKLELSKLCPAVVHVDNTARPQVLVKKNNPLLFNILNYYKKNSGLPVLINTSFNMHGEPIVSDFKDAIRSFESSGLDFLALDKFLVFGKR